MSEDMQQDAAQRTADRYLELAALAELAWQDDRAKNAARRADRAERRLDALENWGPLRLLRAGDESGGTRG